MEKIKIVLCTTSESKIKDIKEVFYTRFTPYQRMHFEILGMKEFTDIDLGSGPEDQESVMGNAIQKAEYYIKSVNSNNLLSDDVILLTEDTGLFITALGGAPGVKTARFSGTHDYKKTNELILDLMKDKSDRSAEVVSSVVLSGRRVPTIGFSGYLLGDISDKESEVPGFAFDTIFKPRDYSASRKYSFSKCMSELLNSERIDLLPRTKAIEDSIKYILYKYNIK